MADRMLKLRYPATRSRCATDLAAGTQAWWSSATKTATCQPCLAALVDATGPRYSEAPSVADSTPEPEVAGIDLGVAGRSAQQRHDQLRGRREENIRSRFPRIGGAILALTDDPQSTKAWSTGARGERRVGEMLDRLADRGVTTLHDSRVPRTRANIDHIAVSSSGVHVIDAKQYGGEVEPRDVGGWLRRDVRLFDNRRDRSSLIAGVRKQGRSSALRSATISTACPYGLRSASSTVSGRSSPSPLTSKASGWAGLEPWPSG